MFYYNGSRFGKETTLLINNPFNGGAHQEGLVPPPGQDFMITEVTHIFMKDETTPSLMVTEA